METKVTKIRIENIARKMGFQNVFIAERQGLAGGLALLWTDKVQINCVWKNNRILCGDVVGVDGFKKWRLFGCHDTP